jgi:hypothetical protein
MSFLREMVRPLSVLALAVLVSIFIKALAYFGAGLDKIPIRFCVIAAVFSPLVAAALNFGLCNAFLSDKLPHAKRLMLGSTTLFAVLASIIVGKVMPGLDFFRFGFEKRVKAIASQGKLQPWLTEKLTESVSSEKEENVRLKSQDIPELIQSLRHSSKPTVRLVYGTKEKRWVYVMVNWREGFLEWGFILTNSNEEEFSRDPDFHMIARGVYGFYH